MLLDLAPRVLAELDPRLSRTAERVLRRRGVEDGANAHLSAQGKRFANRQDWRLELKQRIARAFEQAPVSGDGGRIHRRIGAGRDDN